MIRLSLCLLCSLLLPGALFAERVSVETARQTAAGMFRSAATTASRTAAENSLQLVWDGETAATRSGSDPAFYVFNHTGGGFVIIAGDDAARPVLGYSPTGRFVAENMPRNIRAWFSGIRGQILAAREAGIAPAGGGWGTVSAKTVGEVVRQLETAKWNQDAPYNGLCPKIGSQRAYTGCVATATAIVMRYHRWPDYGTGTLPGYTYTVTSTQEENTVPDHALGHAYDWDNMPLEYDDNATAQQQTAVAQLMYDIGVMAQAEYDRGDGTGAYTSQAVYGLLTNMRYDKSAVLRYRDWSGFEDWDELIRNEIDKFGPVLYAGANEELTSAHQFVIDGYTSTDYFCVNWGWSGQDDGQYLLSALDPDVRGIGGGTPTSDGFNFQQTALLGLCKDESGTSEWTSQLIVGTGTTTDKETYYGLSASTASFQTGSNFNMNVLFIFNIGFAPFNGIIELAVCNHNGVYRETINKESLSLSDLGVFGGSGYSNIPCRITNAIQPGDRIRVRYKGTNESEWKWASGDGDEETVAEIILAEEVDPDAIDANTSLHFDRQSRRMTLSTLDGVAYTLTATADSTVAAHGTADASGTIVIDASSLQGTYVLLLERGSDKLRTTLKF